MRKPEGYDQYKSIYQNVMHDSDVLGMHIQIINNRTLSCKIVDPSPHGARYGVGELILENAKRIEAEQAKKETEQTAFTTSIKNHIPVEVIDKFTTKKTVPALTNRQPDNFIKQQSSINMVTADPASSIERILNALEDAGCVVCAAKLVAKVELKKFKKEEAA